MRRFVFAAAAPAAIGLLLAGGPARQADAPGLLVQFAQGERSDLRTARLLALRVQPPSAPTPFLTSGAFTAEFTGELEIDARDRFTFTFAGAGKLVVEIGGKEVLRAESALPGQVSGSAVRLNRGRLPLVARYESPPDGDAQLRLLWQSPAFGPEPLPPAKLWHTSTPELAAADELRRGRELTIELACARCHPLTGAGTAGTVREEAERIGPDLGRAGAKFTAAWLAQWVRDPMQFRPDTAMPRVLHGTPAEQDADARDLAAWLCQQTGEPEAALPAGDAKLGAELVDQLRCIGCHTLPDQAADPERVPLAHVAAKWRAGALARFLQAPDRDHAWARMPDFRLDAREAAAIAAYLQPEPPPDAPPPGDAARGAQRFEELGCARCHVAGARAATRAALPLADLARGCLAGGAAARGRAPDFAFDPVELAALRALFDRHAGAPATDCTVEDTERLLARARCTACHALDAEQDRWTRVRAAGEERIELPPLTWAGEKLNTTYLQKLLPGREIAYARPWLDARMPGFSSPLAARLALGLAAPHGLSRATLRPGTADARLAQAGAELVSSNGGFGCRQCHAIGGLPPNGVFDVQGIEFTQIAPRLRREYYERWMRDPLRIDPGTKMPRYADANGKTGLVDRFGGDAEQQFAAIWQHLVELAR